MVDLPAGHLHPKRERPALYKIALQPEDPAAQVRSCPALLDTSPGRIILA